MGKFILFLFVLTVSCCALWAAPAAKDTVRKVRFVEDDAQNYMVSKVYILKHQKANDLAPFIIGAVKRYAKNSTVDRINYAAGKQQIIAVTCPVEFMPYVDDMIAKLDRGGKKGADGSGIDGTGIARSVYTPIWRSSKELAQLMIKAGVSSSASEGARQDAVVDFDEATGNIFWKDTIGKDASLRKYLSWLDRPVPQCSLSVNVYEIREADLHDVGLDYLAWKNGPGLNFFEAGANFITGDAGTFGPYGFFMFAPAFDLSFVRILQQNGLAKIATSANVTLFNGHDAEISFAPDFQNIVKGEDFESSIVNSNNDRLTLKIKNPVIAQQEGKKEALINFAYDFSVRSVVERDNHGNELYDETASSGKVIFSTGKERALTEYRGNVEVEQTVGIPFLCELPVLKYIFGTTTKNKEKVHYLVTVQSRILNPDGDIAEISGKLQDVFELMNRKEK